MPTASDVFVDTSGWAYYLDRQDPLHLMIVAGVKQASQVGSILCVVFPSLLQYE